MNLEEMKETASSDIDEMILCIKPKIPPIKLLGVIKKV